MKKKIYNLNCQNCGAHVTTEICPYCKAKTGIDQNLVNLEFPVLEYETLSDDLTGIYIVLGLLSIFLLIGLSLPISFIVMDESIIFNIVGIFFLIMELIIILPIIVKIISELFRYKSIEKNGKTLEAIVYGYIDDKYSPMGSDCKIVKLLVETEEGKRFILFKLNSQLRKYKIGSKINLKLRENQCMISKEKKYYFE